MVYTVSVFDLDPYPVPCENDALNLNKPIISLPAVYEDNAGLSGSSNKFNTKYPDSTSHDE